MRNIKDKSNDSELKKNLFHGAYHKDLNQYGPQYKVHSCGPCTVHVSVTFCFYPFSQQHIHQGGEMHSESATVKCIERFSIECRKTKTKVITLANHKGHR